MRWWLSPPSLTVRTKWFLWPPWKRRGGEEEGEGGTTIDEYSY